MKNLSSIVTLVSMVLCFMTPSRAEATCPEISMSRTASADRLSPQQLNDAVGMMANGSAYLGDINTLKDSRLKKPSEAAYSADPSELITEKPEGTEAMYCRYGRGYRVFFGMVLPHNQQGVVLETVTSPDGKEIYLKNYLSSAVTDTWIKGEINDSQITVPMGQLIYWSDSYDVGYTIGVGKFEEITDENGTYATYIFDESVTEVNYTIEQDGSIRIEDRFFSEESYSPYIIGLFYTTDHTWSGYANWNSLYKPFNETANKLPDGVEMSQWVFDYDRLEWLDHITYMVQAGFKDDKCYIAGLIDGIPDYVVYGTVNGSQITFEPNQYVGIYDNTFCFFNAAGRHEETYTDPVWGEQPVTVYTVKESPFSFSFDPENNIIYAPEETSIIVNGARYESGQEPNPIYTCDNPVFRKFIEVPAIPATPEIVYLLDKYEESGYINIQINLPCFDTEGNYLDPEKLFYKIYFKNGDDITPFTFTADEYCGLPAAGYQTLEEVPYGLTVYDENGIVDIEYAAQVVYFYTAPPEEFGIQSIYYGGGVRNETGISWYATDGVMEIGSDREASVTGIYTIDGIRLEHMRKGINILRMSDGTSRKVIVR